MQGTLENDHSAIRPELKDRFVFWTGGVFAPETISFIEDLSSPCITKPFKAKELIVHVEQMLGQKDVQ